MKPPWITLGGFSLFFSQERMAFAWNKAGIVPRKGRQEDAKCAKRNKLIKWINIDIS